MKQLKTATKQPINIGMPSGYGSDIVILTDVDPVQEVSHLKDQRLIHNEIVGLFEEFGTEYRFIYRLEKFNKSENRCLFTELGIGELVESNNQIRLARTNPLKGISENLQAVELKRPMKEIEALDEDEIILITTLYPESAGEALHDPHAIVYSNEQNKFNQLIVESNSLIGREGSSDIQGISFDTIISYFCNLSKKISLKTKDLVCSKITSKHIVLSPSKSKLEEEGCIRYDSSSKKLQLFDGKAWKNIKYEDT